MWLAVHAARPRCTAHGKKIVSRFFGITVEKPSLVGIPIVLYVERLSKVRRPLRERRKPANPTEETRRKVGQDASGWGPWAPRPGAVSAEVGQAPPCAHAHRKRCAQAHLLRADADLELPVDGVLGAEGHL